MLLTFNGVRLIPGLVLAAVPAAVLAQTTTEPPIVGVGPDAAFGSNWAFAAIPLLVGLGAILVSVLVIRSAGRSRRQAQAAQSWPTVPATVTAGEVAARKVSRGTGNDRRRTTVYTALVRYTYTVGGQVYEGNRVSFGNPETSFRGTAEKVLAKYPVGSQITVRHDPATPSNSTIEATAGSTAGQIAIAAVIGLVGVLAALVGLYVLLATLG